MATTTPNFGWSVPTSTDLVKDGATAIETLGDSIDASLVDLKGGTTGQVLAKASNSDMDFVWSADAAGMTNPMTTTGDTIYSSSGSTPARLGIGSTGNVLTVAGGVPTWAAPSSAKPSFALLSTTNLTGVDTFTITSLSGYNTFYLIVKNASSTLQQNGFRYRINGNTSNVYRAYGLTADMASSYSTSLITQSVIETTSLPLGNMSNQAGSQVSGSIRIEGCNSTGIKMTQSVGGASPESGANQSSLVLGGFIEDSNVVSSITFFTTGGTFDNGTLRIYGSVA